MLSVSRSDMYSYCGQFPDLDQFISPMDSEEKRVELEMFVKQKKDSGCTFKLVEELVHYCQNDTYVLLEGSLCFVRESFSFENHLKEMYGKKNTSKEIGYYLPFGAPFSTGIHIYLI